ncbi:MAG TPA: GNAT family N-acetyltransferase [Candidatus Saccharimonadales bacterium]|nr:GNAT family N-acetyltransferase [Candidatus Saccharimonadales bacterium]
MTIKRFYSFDEIKSHWIELENQTPHYPFQSFWYQKLFAEKFCIHNNIYLLGVYEDANLLAIGGFEKIEGTIIFLGMKQVLNGQDVTDYGDLLWKENISEQQTDTVWEEIIVYFQKQNNTLLQLDFVREDSLTYKSLQKKSALTKLQTDMQEVAPFITAPDSWEGYLSSLERKQRHELKRKIKRFEDQHAFHFCSNETIKKDFEEFIRLHRASDQAKEKFMSEEMKQFFWDIISTEKTDYKIDFCFLNIQNKPVASIMSFIGQGKTLLYNSGFDPEYSYYSVGLILHAYLIKKSIEEKLAVHDFLRGNERYKYDLGAQNMQLYKMTLPI